MSTVSQGRQERKVTLVLDDDSLLEPVIHRDSEGANFLDLATAPGAAQVAALKANPGRRGDWGCRLSASAQAVHRPDD